ncbi:MAG: ABC transporter ATP-binding protein [Bacillaceae bacterium]
METVLSVKHVTKTIGKRDLVHDISFDVRRGEVFGFLGPNGAGKTTTIRMLVGLIKQTSGTISIGGHDVQQDFCKAMEQVGAIVENPELYTYLTGWENLKQFSRMLQGVDEKRINEVVKMVNLENRIHERVKTYSLGMKQRLGIAQALLGNPSLLILDEPTNGLDPMGIRELRVFIRQLVERNQISVFVSSHLLSEIELLCDRVGIIHHGKMVAVSTVKELMARSTERIEWTLSDKEKAKKILLEQGFDDLTEKDGKLMCKMTKEEIKHWNKTFLDYDIFVIGIRPVVETLEDLFVELTGGGEIG